MQRLRSTGARGPRPRLGRVAAALFLSTCACACASDGPPRPIRAEFDLHDPDPVRRLEAVQAVAAAGDRRYVPAVIEMLDDRDEAVRLVAIGALRDLTDFDTDYRAFAPRAERRAHVQQWRAWYAASVPAVPTPAAFGPGVQ